MKGFKERRIVKISGNKKASQAQFNIPVEIQKETKISIGTVVKILTNKKGDILITKM